MRPLSFLVLTLSVLLLASCRSGLSMADTSIKPGEYKIAAMEIIAKPELPATSQPALEVFRPLLQTEIEEDLALRNGQGRDVWLSVQVNKLDLKVSGGQSLLIGDRREVHSDVVLMEPQTRRVLGSKTIITKGEESEGLAGLLANNILSDERQNKNLASLHAAHIVDQLYP